MFEDRLRLASRYDDYTVCLRLSFGTKNRNTIYALKVCHADCTVYSGLQTSVVRRLNFPTVPKESAVCSAVRNLSVFLIS